MKKALKIIGIIVLVLAVSLGTLVFFTLRDSNDPVTQYKTTNPYIVKPGSAMVSAHRSGGGQFPENTLMAFEDCVTSDDFNTDIFEFDLHITKDGQLILLHDETLDRTTNSAAVFGVTEAKPADYTFDEIRKLNFGEGFTDESGKTPYKGLSGDKIPENLRAVKLETALDYLQSHGNYCYIIEIKDSGELGKKAADKLYAVLKDKDMHEKAVIGTFHGDVTKYMDETYPDMLRSCGIVEGIKFYFCAFFGIDRDPGAFNFEALQIPAKAVILNTGTTRVVNYAHKNNIAVQYWTINEEEEIKKLSGIGADAIISDYPARAYAVIHQTDTGELV